MKCLSFIGVALLASASFAMAQSYDPATDVLGAHLNYGRGCAACHAPHSGVYGNGSNANTTDATTGSLALWGEDVGSLYGKPIVTGKYEYGTFTETLPTSLTAGTPDVGGVLMCLSCHDGNYAKGAMMQNQVYEKLPGTYGAGKVPTLLGDDGTTAGNYLNDHPVGLNAVLGCGTTYAWDCTNNSGSIQMTGANSSKFVTNYGFFVSPSKYNGTAVVLCTTCHNQHVMNVFNVTSSNSGMSAGYYKTMFFLRGPYDPSSSTGNTTAQFCRQCHASEANEMNGSSAGTTL
jgi:hypothetical protein